MASSIRVGRDALDAGFSGVIVALCDYPLVEPATVEILICRHAELQGSIITPEYQEVRGHPLLFARSILDELEEGMTLRDVVRKDPARLHVVPVDDPGILIDMDTPDDYARIRTLLNRAQQQQVTI
jgi:molybdenum cofactor cytidylyltransferase